MLEHQKYVSKLYYSVSGGNPVNMETLKKLDVFDFWAYVENFQAENERREKAVKESQEPKRKKRTNG